MCLSPNELMLQVYGHVIYPGGEWNLSRLVFPFSGTTEFDQVVSSLFVLILKFYNFWKHVKTSLANVTIIYIVLPFGHLLIYTPPNEVADTR